MTKLKAFLWHTFMVCISFIYNMDSYAYTYVLATSTKTYPSDGVMGNDTNYRTILLDAAFANTSHTLLCSHDSLFVGCRSGATTYYFSQSGSLESFWKTCYDYPSQALCSSCPSGGLVSAGKDSFLISRTCGWFATSQNPITGSGSWCTGGSRCVYAYLCIEPTGSKADFSVQTTKTKCYLPAGTTGSDTKGEYKYESNCFYTE